MAQSRFSFIFKFVLAFILVASENSFGIQQTFDNNAIQQWKNAKNEAAGAKSNAQGNASLAYTGAAGLAVTSAVIFVSTCPECGANTQWQWYAAGAAAAYMGGSKLDSMANNYQKRMDEADKAICHLTGCDMTYGSGAGAAGGASPTSTRPPNPAAAKALAALNSNGMKFNPDPKNGSLTMPDGKSISAAQIAAGDFSGVMSPSESNLMKAKLADVMNKAKEQVADGGADKGSEGLAADGGMPGGGGGVGSKFNPNAFAMGAGKNGLGFGLGGKNGRKPSSVAGMTKKLANGESIGVAADSIFDMMTRRYEAMGTGDKFIGGN